MARPTRSTDTLCLIYGKPEDFSGKTLPFYREIMLHYWHQANELRLCNNRQEPSARQLRFNVGTAVQDIWKSASIPTVSLKTILDKIASLHDRCQKVKKHLSDQRYPRANTKQEMQKLQELGCKLFDVAACKCVDFKTCCCQHIKKVPMIEQNFLTDQRTERKMVIGGVDKKESKRIAKLAARKLKETVRAQDYLKKSKTPEASVPLSLSDDESSDVDTDVEYKPPKTSEVGRSSRIKLKKTAVVADRYGVPDRAAAALGSAALKDAGLITGADSSLVIDRSKLRRGRQQTRNEVQKKDLHSLQATVVQAIYFDGRKDTTKVNVKRGNKMRIVVQQEEHISIIQQPEEVYLTHISPQGSSAESIASGLTDYLATLQSVDLLAVGCDGTAVNTGWKGGAIALLEKKINRPLQWFICLLHANELPLQHLVQQLDGHTSGPYSYSGAIGQQLQNCEQLPVVKFEAIACNIESAGSLNFDNLSTDQRYMIEMARAIHEGKCPSELAARHPGNLNHFRCCTTANRLMRLWVATKKPSANLKHIIHFVLKIYIPMWFRIRANPSCTEGPRHLGHCLALCKELPVRIKKIVLPVLQTNAFFAHPENLLLAMVTDNRDDVRRRGIQHVIKARQSHQQPPNWPFKVPQILFNATDYADLINWEKEVVTAPPVLRNYSNEELRDNLSLPTTKPLLIPSYPCHTQSVERCVKNVTEAASAVVGFEARDGFIRVRIASRKAMPKFDTKADYKPEFTKT